MSHCSDNLGHVACVQPPLEASDSAKGFIAAKADDGVGGDGVYDVVKEVH